MPKGSGRFTRPALIASRQQCSALGPKIGQFVCLVLKRGGVRGRDSLQPATPAAILHPCPAHPAPTSAACVYHVLEQRQARAPVRRRGRLPPIHRAAHRGARRDRHAPARLVPDAQPLAPRPVAARATAISAASSPADPAPHPGRHGRHGTPARVISTRAATRRSWSRTSSSVTVCRYVERNPVRAGLVASAADWPHGRWPSSPPRRRRACSTWPLPRPTGWAALVDRPGHRRSGGVAPLGARGALFGAAA